MHLYLYFGTFRGRPRSSSTFGDNAEPFADPDQECMDTRIEALANTFWAKVGTVVKDEDEGMDSEEGESTTSARRGGKARGSAQTKTESDADSQGSKAKRGRGAATKTSRGRGAATASTSGGRGRGRGRATAVKEEEEED